MALVTGSSSGIGAAVARSPAADAVTVVVNSRTSAAAGEAVATAIGGTYLQADVGDPEGARARVGGVLAAHGRLDILVNNAGTTRFIAHDDLDAATPEVWMEISTTNVIGPRVLISAALAAWRDAPGGGMVVNVGSVAGIRAAGSSIP